MAKQNLADLRKKEVADLAKIIIEKRKEAIEQKIELGMGKEKNVRKIKNLRREIAQLITISKEKEALNG
ncbi:MAG: ribosomal protein [Patescibacteria group bacterium]|nr:ribosomal protein [Patescibacteria group bacterium]